MTEPTASPDVTDERLREIIASAQIYIGANGYDPDPEEIIAVASALLALRQEVERLREDRDSQQREAIKALERATTAEASLRLATQRREDVSKAMIERANSAYFEASRAFASTPNSNMRAALEAALALQPKEN